MSTRLGLLCALAVSAGMAADMPYAGKWKVNLAKSDFGQLFRGGFARGERTGQERFRRAAEGALHEVARELPLRPFARARRVVDVRAARFVAAHQPLFGHDLHELQHGAVLRRFAAADHLVYGAHGGGADAPQDREDFEFGFGGSGRLACHIRRRYY